jgi:hypothetical protein
MKDYDRSAGPEPKRQASGAGKARNEKLANKRKKVAQKFMKPIGYRVQGPDAQAATGTMGKQPIKVYRKMRGN